MSTGNLVIDPTFIAPQDWCDGATTWPAGVSVEDSSIFVAAYGAVSLAFYPPASGGEIVVGAGQIAVGNVLAFSGYIFPMSTLLAGHPYFGLLDYNGTLLVDALPNSTGLAAGTYTVAAGVTSIRPVFNFNGCEFAPALPSRLGWSAGHAVRGGRTDRPRERLRLPVHRRRHVGQLPADLADARGLVAGLAEPDPADGRR